MNINVVRMGIANSALARKAAVKETDALERLERQAAASINSINIEKEKLRNIIFRNGMSKNFDILEKSKNFSVNI